MLRVLVVLPMYGGSLPVGRYCASGLAEAGCLVEIFEAPDFHGAYSAITQLRVSPDRLDMVKNSFFNVLSQAVLAKVEAFAPDLVLALAQAPLSRQTLKQLRKDGVATAMWFVEDYLLFPYWRAFAPFYDFFAVIQKTPFLDELAAIGVENALYLPLAADPGFHEPLDLNAVERRRYGADLAFLGAGYPNRRIAFRQLLRYEPKIWGSDWDGDASLAPYVQLQGARVSAEDGVKIFNATKINLNLHSSMSTDALVSGGDFVNPRTFELAACGAFQLVDKRSLLPELFGPDELATFASLDELQTLIDQYLGKPEEREAIAKRGRARVLAEHTYRRRVETLLDFIRARRPGWPTPRAANPALLADYPEDLRTDLGALLNTLKLPQDAPFDDVVWTLRQQNGRLAELDAAILFLDEWRKQYGVPAGATPKA
jgi:spore maturation protein CgeB